MNKNVLFGQFDPDSLQDDDLDIFYGQRRNKNRSDKRLKPREPMDKFKSKKSKELFSNKENLKRNSLQKMKDEKLLASNFIQKENFCLNKLVISPENKIRNIWDVIMMIILVYSCLSTGFYTAFGMPTLPNMTRLENFVDFCFFLDILLCFFKGYVDEETMEIVMEFKVIAKNYVFGWFPVDIIAIVPLGIVVENTQVIKLIRLLRLPRLVKIFSERNFFKLLEVFLVNASTQNKMKILTFSKFLFRIIRNTLITTMFTYFLGCLWFVIISQCSENPDDKYARSRCFYYKFELDQAETDWKKLVICCYFILTTLSTVGYGDYVPLSIFEKLIDISFFILGITFFSYFMSLFTDILMNYRKNLGIVDISLELELWLTAMNKFAKTPMKNTMVNEIFEHFKYIQKNNRLAHVKLDDKYMSILSDSHRKEMIKHLFQDVFYRHFRRFFMVRGKEYENYEFYVDLAFSLLPKMYKPGQIIKERGEMVNEINFIMAGELEVFFEYEDDVISKFFSQGFYFGDYNLLSGRPTEYGYRAVSQVDTYIISSTKFFEIMEKYDDVKQHIVSSTFQLYKETSKAMMIVFAAHLSEKAKRQITFKEAQNVFIINTREVVSQKHNPIDSGLSTILDALVQSGLRSEKINMAEKIAELRLDLLKIKHELIQKRNPDLVVVLEEGDEDEDEDIEYTEEEGVRMDHLREIKIKGTN